MQKVKINGLEIQQANETATRQIDPQQVIEIVEISVSIYEAVLILIKAIRNVFKK